MGIKASETEAKTSKSGTEGEEKEEYEVYEVEIVQPYGLKFRKGRDGGTYIDAIAPGGSADKSGKFTVGDKVLATRYLLSLIIPVFWIFSSYLNVAELVFYYHLRRN